MLKKIEGIIISDVPYGETSLIINVFTKELGIIGIIAKGAMNIKSNLRPMTQKFTYGVFNIYYKKDKLSNLISVEIINPLKNIKSDIIKISYLTYLCDLINQVLKQVKNNTIYDNLISTILKIEDSFNPMVLTNILEVKLLDYLGVGLNLISCVECGNKKDIVTLSSEKGGLICKNCYSNERLVPLSYIKILNMYYLVDIKNINKLNIKDKIIIDIDNFITSYYEDYTGLYLKSKKFLKTIQNVE